MILTLFQVMSAIVAVVAVLGPIGAIAAFIFGGPAAVAIITKLIGKFLDCRFCIVLATIIVASVLSFWVGRHEVHEAYRRGVDDTVAKFARADAKLVARAKAARGALLKCQNENKEWDQSTGTCK